MIAQITRFTDKYTNLLHVYIDKIKTILAVNKLIFINNKYSNMHILDDNILNLCNKLIGKAQIYLHTQKIINIILHNLRHTNTINGNKLILRLSNSCNIVIYIPFINKIKIDLCNQDYKFIRLSSTDMNYLTQVAMLIKNIKKIDLGIHVGMYYEHERIKLKKRLSLKDDKKKK